MLLACDFGVWNRFALKGLHADNCRLNASGCILFRNSYEILRLQFYSIVWITTVSHEPFQIVQQICRSIMRSGGSIAVTSTVTKYI